MAQGSSSTKKAAKLAQQRSTSAGPRFQGGVFPLAMMLVIIIGVVSIVWARATRPDPTNGRPSINDHWHAAYGINICGTWYQFAGNLEEVQNGALINTRFARSGIHSHDDGVIHWHPYSAASTGENAKLGVFFDSYDAKLTDTVFSIGDGTKLVKAAQQTAAPSATTTPGTTAAGGSAPTTSAGSTTTTSTTTATTAPATTTQSGSAAPASTAPGATGPDSETGPKEWKEAEATCDGKPIKITLLEWTNYQDAEPARDLTASLDQIRVDKDFLTFGIYITNADQPREKPPWAANLPALGAVDTAGENALRQNTPTGGSINPNAGRTVTTSATGASAVTTTPAAPTTPPATTTAG